jgi:hypothetical protein
MDVICHDSKRSELIVSKFHAAEKRVDHQPAIASWRKKTLPLTPSREGDSDPEEDCRAMPSHEQPTTLQIEMRQPAPGIHVQ